MNVLLLSAYDAQSHRRWRDVLTTGFDEFDWTVLTLPPRYFNWRLRGNSLSWAFTQRDVLEQNYDLIIATSMVDLSALRGFVPALARCPTLLYFHENQFAYPPSEYQFSSVEPQMLNLYSALAADYIAFNSAYNRNTFLQGVSKLLSKMPDRVPSGISRQLQQVSCVLPVPLADSAYNLYTHRVSNPGKRLSIVWNHRWEYDKAPDRLFKALQFIFEKGVEIDCHIIGQQFRKIPPVFEQMKSFFDTNYPHCIKHWGYVESDKEYREILHQSDVVVSTALHDFQGLAIMEAVAAGCTPLLPNRLCYGEWFESRYLYESFADNPEKESRSLAEHLILLSSTKSNNALPAPPDISSLAMGELKKSYQQIIRKTIDEHGQLSTKPVL